jgi:DNA invertase Pin-like site-specific DNA recombinase
MCPDLALRPLRRSTRELVNALEELNGLGIDFFSYTEGADTTTPRGKLVFGIMASLAEFERSLIAERVKAGMQRTKAQGKHTGRPALPLSSADRSRSFTGPTRGARCVPSRKRSRSPPRQCGTNCALSQESTHS